MQYVEKTANGASFGKKEERMFMIYGVKHFDDISAWMKDFMILSADEQF